MTGHAPGQRVRQGHAELAHAVALQELVAGHLPPPLQRGDGQRRRSRHHQPGLRRAGRPPGPRRGVGRLPRRDEPGVDRRHRHEQRQLTGGEPLPRGDRVEAPGCLTGGAGRPRAEAHRHDPVHVVEGEDQQDAILRGPRPGGEQRVDLRRQAAVGVDDALGPARRAARVDDHRRCRSIELRELGISATARGRVHDDDRVGEAAGQRFVLRRADRHRHPCIGDEVGELLIGMRGVQGHGHAAGLPAAEEPAHEVVARSAQQRDAFAVAGTERGGDRDGVAADVGGGRSPSWIDDRWPVHAEETQQRAAAVGGAGAELGELGEPRRPRWARS